METNTAKTSLGELAGFFLRLGTTAFGGPAAHIAMMEDEVVRRRGWLTRERFLDLLGASNLIPGPSSTELAIHIGYTQCGWAGLVLGGLCFILPAALLVGALAWVYTAYGSLPQVASGLYGIKPVVIAIILQALWGLGRSALKTKWLALLALMVGALDIAGFSPVVLLFAAGALVALARARMNGRTLALTPLFLVFLKIGAIVFGSGYTLLAFLRSDLIERYHWLTEAQLIDAVAVGQFTPGPVFTTATFIGYLVDGVPGAVVATVAIFLPAFILVAVSAPYIPKLRASKVFGGFLDGVNAASLALMAVVALQLGKTSFIDIPTVAIFITAAVLLLKWRINSAWLVLSGAAVGVLIG